jgi:hypothetical protein
VKSKAEKKTNKGEEKVITNKVKREIKKRAKIGK